MSPDQLNRLLQAAVSHHRAGRLEEACTLYSRMRAAAPRHFDANHLGGMVALQLGRAGEAVTLLTKALRLDPKSGVCEMRLGLAYLSLGRIPEAETHLRRVIAQQPQFHEAWDNLGMVLKSAGRIDEALAAHRRSIELQPRHATGWYNLGATHSLLGHSAAALACHEHALAADPNHPNARYGRAQALQQLHRIDEAIAAYDDQLARFPQHHEARSARLLALNYSNTLPRETVFAEHAHYGELIAKSSDANAAPFRREAGSPLSADRRLRVAFLSPDFRTHAVARFIEPLLVHLDKTEFEIVLYHDHFVIDATSERLRAHAAIWRNFVGQPPEVVETQVRADAPDILIDLAGHTGFGRLSLFARRLAPVQISYLGYPNTTGLRTMDYKFTDLLADPPGEADAFHTECLVRFSPTAWSYQPPADAPTPAIPRCSTGAPVTFGSFNNFAKVSDLTLTLWARIMTALPSSRLVLKSLVATDLGFQSRLTRFGLDPARIDLLPPAPTSAAHLAAYEKIDIALDTFPYHGTTTTCEALWMGRPVITLAGNRHASRVGVSLLTAIGHPEWIATTPDDYVRIATDLAGDPARLCGDSARLRDSMANSALLDHPGQAALFGAALRECWIRGGRREPISRTMGVPAAVAA